MSRACMVPPLSSPLFRDSDAVQRLHRPDEDLSTAKRRPCVAFFFQIISGDYRECFISFDHGHPAIIVQKVNVTTRSHERSTKMPSQPFFPMAFASAGLEAAGHPLIRN